MELGDRSYSMEFLEKRKMKNLTIKFKKLATRSPPHRPGTEKKKD